jgi:hypothetical protein
MQFEILLKYGASDMNAEAILSNSTAMKFGKRNKFRSGFKTIEDMW